MGYLDRLKANVSDKCPPCELPKVPKAPFDSFGSGQGARFQKIEVENKKTSWGWFIHYAGRDPLEVYFSPPAILAEVLVIYRGAIAAEPLDSIRRQPTAPMTADEEAAIRAWLALIEETNPAIIGDVLDRCCTDPDARSYFLGWAKEEAR